MHNQWEEMLPFYVAGSLPKPEATRLEYHLSHCNECSGSLNDWRLIAAAVRAEAASQLRDLPPLSPEVLRTAAERLHSQRYSGNTLAFAPMPTRREQPARRLGSTWVTIAAAAFTVLLLGGLLTLMALRITPTQQGSNGVVLAPSATPSETGSEAEATQTQLPVIVVIEPSITPTPRETEPTRVPATSIAPSTVIVPTRIPPTFVMPTPIAETPMPLEPTIDGEMAFAQLELGTGGGGGGCTLQAAIPSGSVINLYAQPRIDSTVLTTISSAEQLTGLAISDNSWFRLQSERGNVGWVQQGLVSASGNCDGLPLIIAENATVVVATPTETVLPFPTLEPTVGGESGSVAHQQNTAATDSAPPVQS